MKCNYKLWLEIIIVILLVIVCLKLFIGIETYDGKEFQKYTLSSSTFSMPWADVQNISECMCDGDIRISWSGKIWLNDITNGPTRICYCLEDVKKHKVVFK